MGERQNSVRAIALLQTKKNGAPVALAWAESLKASEDRAYSFLGTAEGILGIGEVRLDYSAIRIH